MKKLFLCFFMLLFAIATSAQKRTTDSLIDALNANPNVSGRLAILKILSDQNKDVPTIIKYAKEGISLTAKLNRLKDEEVFLYNLGKGYYKADDAPQLLKCSFVGLELSRRLNDGDSFCQFIEGISSGYLIANKLRKAVDYSLIGLPVAARLGKKKLASFYDNIGFFYIGLNLLDSAEIYIKKSYHIALTINDPNIFYDQHDLGVVESKRGHYKKALYYYYLALPLIMRSDIFHDKNLSDIYQCIAEVYQKTGPADSAFLYANKAYNTARHGDELHGIQKASAMLADMYEGKNDKESLKYYKIASVAKDSLYGSAKTKQLELFEFNQQEEKNELAANQLKYQNHQQKTQLIFVLSGLFAAAVFSFVLVISNRQKQQANKLLKQEQEHLKSTQTQLIQSEKMASLGELTAGIAHEIQNPLNFVNNFSEVNREMIDELEEELKSGNIDDALVIAADLKQNEEKINHHGKRADAIVKGMLEHSRARTGHKEPTDINALADEYLRLSYHGLRAKDKTFNAELVTNLDENLPRINVVQQDMGRVLLNLFNNAFYAVNERRKAEAGSWKPEVTVSTKLENEQVVITLRDNGMGIPEAIKDKIMQPFFTTKPTGEGTGLGLSLSYDIVVKGHGGTIEVNTKEGECSEFIITLPIS